MGGRGSNYRVSSAGRMTIQQTQSQVQNQAQSQVQSQTQSQIDDLIASSQMVSPYGNNTAEMFSNMSDSQMANALNNSRHVDMPSHVADVADNTQSFSFYNQLNAKPTILDDASFDKFMKDNNISDQDVLIREINPISFKSGSVRYTYSANDVSDMLKTSDINYIGGKNGGQLYGAGTYFGQVGKGGRTYYGHGNYTSVMATFNPKTAKVISYSNISSAWSKFCAKNPQTASAFKRNYSSGDVSVKALLMGYNVITGSSRNTLTARNGEYYNVIDRSALVIRARNGNT